MTTLSFKEFISVDYPILMSNIHIKLMVVCMSAKEQQKIDDSIRKSPCPGIIMII